MPAMRVAWRWSLAFLSRVSWSAGIVFIGLGMARVTPAAETAREVISVTIETENRFVAIEAEVACSRAERALGLMGRETLDQDAGMIFLVPKPRIMRMWMADTPLPLDFIFFDSSGVIKRIEENAEPMSEHTIDSGDKAFGVLELRGGRASELEIKLNNRVLYDYPQWRCEN